MSEAQREAIVLSLADVVITLLNTKFPSIGSLYSSVGDASAAVGPMIPTCDPRCFRKDLSLDRGPWKSEREYLLACIARERHWISAHTEELDSKWTAFWEGYRQSVKDGKKKALGESVQHVLTSEKEKAVGVSKKPRKRPVHFISFFCLHDLCFDQA